MTPISTTDGVFLTNVPFVPQPSSELCWAACCEMVFKGYGIQQPTLCSMATAFTNYPCCPDPAAAGDRCNQTNWPDDVYRNNGFSRFLYGNFVLSFANVEYEIDRGRPINVLFQWGTTSDEGKHLILICGYYNNGDLLVHDPLQNGASRYGYDYVRYAYNQGSWAGTYYNLQPNP